MMILHGYEAEVRDLKRELGGGFVAFAPELTGCVADGESRMVALLNLEDAILCWIRAARTHGRPVPAPQFAEA